MKHKLTAKQQKFVAAYIKDANATQAAIEAGYSDHTAARTGSENLQKPDIKSAIDKQMQKLESAKIATADEVLKYFTTVVRGEAKEKIVLSTPLGAKVVENEPSIKDRMAAGKELLKRYPGVSELLDAQTRKAKADADITEMQRDALRGEGYKNPLLSAIAKGAADLLPKEDDHTDEDKS